MKKKLMAVLAIAIALCGLNVSAETQLMSERVIAVTPCNESTEVNPQDCEMVITYADDVNADEKTVRVNGSEKYTDSVTAENSELKIKFFGLSGGTRYKVTVDGTEGNDITTFFTTAPYSVNYSKKYEKGNFKEFYNRAVYGTATVTDNKFTFSTTDEGRRRGCGIVSNELSINAEESKEIAVKLNSKKAVTLNLYFNTTGKDEFTDKVSVNLSGGEEEIKFNMADVEAWSGTIKKLMLEQQEPIKNTINVSYIYVCDLKMKGTFAGSFDIYENFGTADEKIITDTAVTGEKATVSVGAMKSEENKGAFLVAVFFKDGKMQNGVSRYIDLSDGNVTAPVSVEIDTQPGGYVKAFLRNGIKDLTSVIPSISTAIN